ncbi:MAG: hypothetical protein ACI84O_001312 [Myxococcota bacterium]|jgi:hypothetical protein
MSVCLNCAAAIHDDFCSKCGQEAKTKRAPIIDVIRDGLGDFFAFDSRIFKSFLPLILRPGRLTEMYLEGKRTQLISPVRMYIFVSFIFFFFVMPDSNDINDKVQKIKDNPEIEQNIIEMQELEEDPEAKQSIIDLRALIDNPETEQKVLGMLNDSIRMLPHFLVLSIPLLAMALGIAHRRPKGFLYDHLIFSLHIHTFLFLSMMALSLIPSKSAVLIFLPLYFIYWVIAIKRCYKRSWKVTIPKTVILFIADPIILFAMAMVPVSRAVASSGF